MNAEKKIGNSIMKSKEKARELNYYAMRRMK